MSRRGTRHRVSLLALNYDVLSYTLSLLDSSDLSRFARASRHAHDLATPALASNVELRSSRQAVSFCIWALADLPARTANLRTLTVFGMMNEGSGSLDDGAMLAATRYERHLSALLPRAHNLTRLTILCAELVLEAAPQLRGALVACRRLAFLHLDQAGILCAHVLAAIPGLRETWLTLENGDFGRALRPSAASLEAVTLESSYAVFYEEEISPAWPVCPRVHTLTIWGGMLWDQVLLVGAFPNLRHLVLSNADVLPQWAMRARERNSAVGVSWPLLESLTTDFDGLLPLALRCRVRDLVYVSGDDSTTVTLPMHGRDEDPHARLIRKVLRDAVAYGRPERLEVQISADVAPQKPEDLVELLGPDCRVLRLGLYTYGGVDVIVQWMSRLLQISKRTRLVYLALRITHHNTPVRISAGQANSPAAFVASLAKAVPGLQVVEINWDADPSWGLAWWRRRTDGNLCSVSKDLGYALRRSSWGGRYYADDCE